MNNENETAAALERARCEVRFFREVLAKIATPWPRFRRLKLAQAALGFWASLCDRGAGDLLTVAAFHRLSLRECFEAFANTRTAKIAKNAKRYGKEAA